MPFIHIKSLPLEQQFNVTEAIIAIGKDFAKENDIPLNHVHTTWVFYKPGHYAKGDVAPKYQPEKPHSVIVDLLTPDFNNPQTIRQMLISLAHSISRRANIPLQKIFIHHRPAASENVFDDGKVVSW